MQNLTIGIVVFLTIASVVVVFLLLRSGLTHDAPSSGSPTSVDPGPGKSPGLDPFPSSPTCKEACPQEQCQDASSCCLQPRSTCCNVGYSNVGGECLLNCGTGTCASGQNCVTIDNAVCTDPVYAKTCSSAVDKNQNCFVNCDGDAKKAYMCYQSNDCRYQTNNTAALPQMQREVYPLYVPSAWTLPQPSDKKCVDLYKGLDGGSYCLGEVLFGHLEANPSNSKDGSQPDVIEQTLQDWTATAKTMGQSEKGYYCIPEGSQGWRYTIFPTDDDNKGQCTVADCMIHALSASDVKQVYFDEESKACMAATCEGADCNNLACVGTDCPKPPPLNLKTSNSTCDQDHIAQEKQDCFTATGLQCNGKPDNGGLQLWDQGEGTLHLCVTNCEYGDKTNAALNFGGQRQNVITNGDPSKNYTCFDVDAFEYYNQPLSVEGMFSGSNPEKWSHVDGSDTTAPLPGTKFNPDFNDWSSSVNFHINNYSRPLFGTWSIKGSVNNPSFKC